MEGSLKKQKVEVSIFHLFEICLPISTLVNVVFSPLYFSLGDLLLFFMVSRFWYFQVRPRYVNEKTDAGLAIVQACAKQGSHKLLQRCYMEREFLVETMMKTLAQNQLWELFCHYAVFPRFKKYNHYAGYLTDEGCVKTFSEKFASHFNVYYLMPPYLKVALEARNLKVVTACYERYSLYFSEFFFRYAFEAIEEDDAEFCGQLLDIIKTSTVDSRWTAFRIFLESGRTNCVKVFLDRDLNELNSENYGDAMYSVKSLEWMRREFPHIKLRDDFVDLAMHRGKIDALNWYEKITGKQIDAPVSDEFLLLGFSQFKWAAERNLVVKELLGFNIRDLYVTYISKSSGGTREWEEIFATLQKFDRKLPQNFFVREVQGAFDWALLRGFPCHDLVWAAKYSGSLVAKDMLELRMPIFEEKEFQKRLKKWK